MKRYSYLFLIGIIPFYIFLNSGCQKVLDKKVLNNIQDEAVWRDTTLMEAFMNNLYTDLPSWDLTLSKYTDESYGRNAVTDGTISPDNNPLWYWSYTSIRKCNTILANLQDAVGSQSLKNRLEGETKFIRAYQYFAMVRRLGGVPIITIPQDLNDSILIKRNKTSECIDFIIGDLDDAASLLPATAPSNNNGRATRDAALSLKARVLMSWASPRFNPDQNADRWQKAYDACEEALNQLNNDGYGLYSPYSDLLLDEMNKEVIFAIRYNNPGRTQSRDATVRPISESVNHTGGDEPSQKLVEAYLTKEGKEVNSSTPYQERWKDRGDRFSSTIVYNGAIYFGKKIWTYANGTIDGFEAVNGTHTGYYSRKGIDTTLTAAQAGASGTDFVAIRYTDILMLDAEAANELGNTTPGYKAIEAVRERAGIESGTNELYGLKLNMSQSEMRARLHKERFIEFAFEQIRFWDLLRWNKLYSTLNGKKRHGLLLTKISDNPLRFKDSVVATDNQKIEIQRAGSYFFPISRSELRVNPNLKQTKGWENGSFDPLK